MTNHLLLSKYTNTGYIEIGYKLLSKGKDQILELFVKDTGKAINPKNQQIIFERFSREEMEEAKFIKGLGLGLAIAKENTELLVGNIYLQSVENKGTTFFYYTLDNISISRNPPLDYHTKN